MTILPRSNLSADLSGYVSGEGPDAVLLHGVGLRADAWAPMLGNLAERFRVHVLDLPGHGHSRFSKHQTLQDYADTIQDYAGTLDRPYLIGHSMGAMIALEMAMQTETDYRGVAALNAIYQRAPAAADAVRRRADELRDSPAPDPEPTLTRWFGANPNADLSLSKKLCREWLTTCDKDGYANAYRVFAYHEGPSAAGLKDMRIPAIFITGSDEPNSTPDMSKAMAKIVPNGQAIIVEGAAHMGPMTHPNEYAGALIGHMTEDCTNVGL